MRSRYLLRLLCTSLRNQHPAVRGGVIHRVHHGVRTRRMEGHVVRERRLWRQLRICMISMLRNIGLRLLALAAHLQCF